MGDERYESYDEGPAAPYADEFADGRYGRAPREQGYADQGYASERPSRAERAPRSGADRARTSAAGREQRDSQRPAGGRGRGAAPAPSAGNPVLNGLKAAGGAVAGAFGSVAGAVSSRAAQARAVQYEEGDYVGTGAPCRMCGHPVDHLQSRCPHCGALVRPLYQRTTFWIAVIVAVVLVVVLTLAISSCKANQPGVPAATGTVSAAAELQTLVDSSEAALTEQRETHPYTRYTAYNLRQAVTAAEDVLAAEDSTAAQRTEAYSNLENAKNALMQLVSTYDWPVFGDDLLTSPAKWSTKQVGLNVNVVSVNMAEDGGLSSMVVCDPSNAANQLTVYFYPVDMTASFDVDSNVNLYGEFVYDGTNMALWADKVEVL